MFGRSWRVGRIVGVEIRIDISWALIVVLVTYSLYLQFTDVFPQLTTVVAISLAAGSALLFFASVLIHEMAHALVALNRGIPVRGITLFLFGGATHAKVEAKGPGAEFLVAVVGPLTSLLLAGLFGAVGVYGDGILPREVAGTFGYLGWVNLVLAVFNLVPGFPLDGGRVLRSIVWKVTGSLHTATRVAGVAGQIVGYLLMAGGFALVFADEIGSGIWLAAIGWFLAQAARSSAAQTQLLEMLEGVAARDVMMTEAAAMAEPAGEPTVSPETSVETVLTKLDTGRSARVLVMEDGDLVGEITRSDIARWLRRQAVQS